jgi:hypothetical protein
LNNTVTWKTSAYRPAVFTAVDDDTIGDSFASVSGANYHGFITVSGYANPAIYGCVAEFVGNRNRNGGLAAESFG